MDFNELLEKRRSIRAFAEGSEVSDETVKAIVEAALMAPSWKNSETGRYYVVKSPEMLTKVKEECLPAFNARSSANAPVLIVTCFEKGISGFGEGSPVNELGDKWGAYDLGLQNQNLVMKASDLGYDTLIMGIRDEKALCNLLSIPESQDVVAVIALGKRDKDPKAPVRKSLDEVCKIF